MELFRTTPKFDFLGKWKICVFISLCLIAWTIYIWIDLGEKKYGVDFTGGHELIVAINGPASSDKIRIALEKAQLPDVNVQSFEAASNEYSIRLGGETDAKLVRSKVDEALKKSFGDKVEILKTDFVGPTIGKELRQKALFATALGILAILIYMTFRFEFAFGLGAVAAVFHDVIVATGVYLTVGHTINMGTVAAALTILGYSVNDTIVVFDRVREEILKRKEFDLAQLLNESMNAMLGRTLITTGLTLCAVLALLIFGGGAIADLSLFLFAGMIAGTYSTVYIAAPVVLGWDNFRNRKRTAVVAKAES